MVSKARMGGRLVGGVTGMTWENQGLGLGHHLGTGERF